MSEPKDLSGIIHMWHDKLPPGYQNKKLLDEICRLVEHGPEVSREWVEQLVNLILNTGEEYVVDFAIKELHEAGVTVKEGKEHA